jgi:hypothetical protein
MVVVVTLLMGYVFAFINVAYAQAAQEVAARVAEHYGIRR